jgi:hypothetical protein
VSATRTVVRPARRNGATKLVFRLSRPAMLRIMVVRVYPKCKVVGSFSVRGRAGMNRITFRGWLGGRPLPVGAYRLVVRARGASRNAAAVPIVIARGPVSRAALRRTRTAPPCSAPIALLGEDEVAAIAGGSDEGAGRVLATITKHVRKPLGAVAGVVSRTTQGLSQRVEQATDDPFGRFVLTALGALLLLSAILGAVVLTRIARGSGLRIPTGRRA